MSGFASSLMMSSAFTPPRYEGIPEEESAGKAGKWLGIAAAIFIPMAAPAIFGAIAGSGVLGAGLAAAAQTGTMGLLANTLGSAITGGLMNVAAAAAGGARGNALWSAFGSAALNSGLGGFSRASTALNARNAAFANTQANLPSMPLDITPPNSPLNATGNAAAGLTTGTGAVSPSGTILNGIQRLMPNIGGMDLNRVSAAIINAAVNGQSIKGMDDLVAQQRAELDALAASNQAAYQARIGEAQKITAMADAMDPAWRARLAMADVKGAEERATDQAKRNIAVKQGGSLDAGQTKAYERTSKLHTARSGALAWNQAFKQAEGVQAQMRGTAAQLYGADTGGLAINQARYGVEADALRAKDQLRNDSAAGLTTALFNTPYDRPTNSDPSSNEDNEDSNGFTFNPFGSRTR